MGRNKARDTPPSAPTPTPVSPRIVPLTTSQLALNLTLVGMKSSFSGSPSLLAMVEDPQAPPPPYLDLNFDGPITLEMLAHLPTALEDSHSRISVPVSLQEELRELLGEQHQQHQQLAPGEALPPGLVLPDLATLRVSARMEAIARQGVPIPLEGRSNRALLSRLEGGEVVLLKGVQGLPTQSVFTTVKARMSIICPGYYSGVFGKSRLHRLWWRCHGMKIGVFVCTVLLGTGAVALCIFMPIAGIVVISTALLIAGVSTSAASRRRAEGMGGGGDLVWEGGSLLLLVPPPLSLLSHDPCPCILFFPSLFSLK